MHPLCSVIVPVFRQWPQARGFLEAWAGQDACAGQARLILVNNDPAVPPTGLSLPPGARMVECARPGSYAARNAGAAEATGAWLVFTDADCRPQPGWLGGMVAAMRDCPDSLLAGDIRMVRDGPANPWSDFDLVRGIPQRRYVSRGYGATANLAVPAALFRDLGGFDAGRLSGGDADFCRRAGRRGVPIRFVKDAVVEHPARDSWAALRTKARRVKGAQLTQGSRRQRLYWWARTGLPPLHELVFYLRSDHPLKRRLTACGVRMMLWGVELGEALRLLAGRGRPERR